jgi:hypothetical protein
MPNKMKEAADLIKRAQEAGCNASLQGSWVVWEPCLPVDILMESLPLNEQIAKLISGVCSYPDCNCPFDAPADPNWCAKGLPRDLH